MSWFKRRIKPSRPPMVLMPSRIAFIGEQAGPAEDDLKSRFREILVATSTVHAAYLARLSYGDPSSCSVGLCIRSSVGVDRALQKRLAQIFAEVFRAEEQLDILFIREDQEADLRKVCHAFYERPWGDSTLGFTDRVRLLARSPRHIMRWLKVWRAWERNDWQRMIELLDAMVDSGLDSNGEQILLGVAHSR